MKNKFYDDNNKYTILYLSDDEEEIINIKPKQILYHLCNNENIKKMKKNKKKYINNNIEIKNKILEIEKNIIYKKNKK